MHLLGDFRIIITELISLKLSVISSVTMIIEPEGWKRPSLIHPQLSSLLLTDSLLNYIKHLVWGCPLFPATFPSAPRCWDVFSTFHCNNLSFMLVFNLVDKEDKLFLESSQQLCTKLQIVLKSWL